MKLVIADDEPLARQRLQRLLAEIGNVEVIGEAADGLAAVRACHAHAPDLVLLDIRMPVMDGLEAARHLQQLPDPPAIVFVTAYGDHALEAFDAAAVDYLLKPVRRERLERAMERAARLSERQLGDLDGTVGAAPTHLRVTRQGGLELLPVDDVLYFRAEAKYVVARHGGGESLLDDSLKNLEERFGGRFVRIHRNALVALDAFSALERSPEGGHWVSIRGCDERLEVSRRHVAELRERLRRR